MWCHFLVNREECTLIFFLLEQVLPYLVKGISKDVHFSSCCDKYGIPGNYRTAIYLSIKLSTQVFKYQSTQGLSLSISIKLRLTYDHFKSMQQKYWKNCGVGKWQVLYLYSRNPTLCMGPCDLSTIAPKSTATVFPHLKLTKLLCRHHVCSPWLRDRPRALSDDQEIITNFPKLMLSISLNVGKT